MRKALLAVAMRIYVLEPDWKLTEMICEDNVNFNELKKAGKEQ